MNSGIRFFVRATMVLALATIVFTACSAAQRAPVDSAVKIVDAECPGGMALFDGAAEGKVCGTLDMVRAAWGAFEKLAWPQSAEGASPGVYRAAWARELVKAGGVRVGGATPVVPAPCASGPSASCK